MRPLIGITLDWQEEGTYSPRPHHALREHYFDSITRAGGVPVGIPYVHEHIPSYLGHIDGLLIPGGDFAWPKAWYVEEAHASLYGDASSRVQFDQAIAKEALAADMPVLGICAGMQLLAGMHGCKLTADIAAHAKSEIDHRTTSLGCEQVAHDLHIEEGGLLHQITDKLQAEVNSHHQEGVVETSNHVVVEARAPDGVIEAFSFPGKRFGLGVVWHPEYEVTPFDTAILKAFVQAAREG